ncbi:hypothetical protein BY996DRAFT_6585773 [Phakopsora pachyrhizi]|uniref:Xrn1 N-terminal domain-containing protein n=1 Tax=Phakopsora pachyrhizi TaxID=170000 RepID=A0AAV0B7E6_PHAPC|nr:hypothetical protein BY996DRAFT_6585773 [Phakopsora pachyrhizi]CAH7681889.1 hypothetical protein PPACK8108_LOCUS14556 [Phakopsora pachyrhizi]
MEFIFRSRTQPSYNPNTRHMIYRLDADLIMLSLATHDPNFKALREDVFSDERRRKECNIWGQLVITVASRANEFDIKHKPTDRKPFIFLDVSTLREYHAVELNMPQKAEERQDHIFKRLKIEADSRQKNMQFPHNSPPQSLPSSTDSSSLAPRLPPKPSFSPTSLKASVDPVDFLDWA